MVHYTVGNLDAEVMHFFVLTDGLETSFGIIDDSQKVTVAVNG